MTTGKKAGTGKGKVKKLNIKKDTIRDLPGESKANGVKGGRGLVTQTCNCVTGLKTCLCLMQP